MTKLVHGMESAMDDDDEDIDAQLVFVTRNYYCSLIVFKF